MSLIGLKSPASRLFTQAFIQEQIKENIKAPRHWAFVRGIHRWPVNSPHKGPVTRKLWTFDDAMEALFVKEIPGLYDILSYWTRGSRLINDQLTVLESSNTWCVFTRRCRCWVRPPLARGHNTCKRIQILYYKTCIHQMNTSFAFYHE